jgi:NADH-quinone oxidoreductase subunit F
MSGEGKPEDIQLIDNIAKNMAGTTLCALGDFAANPIIHTIKNFPSDFEAHMNAKAVEPAAPAAAGAGRGRGARAQATAGD